jgi:hypothetical protein
MPSPPRVTAAPTPSPAPRHGSSVSSPPHYSGHAEPRWSATWLMINAARCGAKSSPSGGAVVPVRGRACQCHPGPGSPPCGGVTKGVAPGSGVGGGGGGAGSRRGHHRHRAWRNMPESPTASADQDLCWSEAWLGKCRQLAGVIRAVVSGLPPKAHRCGRGGGEHLARPWRGTGGRVVGDMSRCVMNVHHSTIIPKKMQFFTCCVHLCNKKWVLLLVKVQK